eukprot:GSChrysophyteH1.ASY1.ANO1.3244.1 assembled CDS
MEGFEVDCRIRDSDGFRGTVRYIGPVAAAKSKEEIWLGVEWDKQGRGKHDGSCTDKEGNLHRYFECTNGSGSFVRPSKKTVITQGRSFETALRERYVDTDAPKITKEAEGDNTLPDSFVVTAKGNAKPIEFFGETKIRKWQQLGKVESIAVRDDTVSSIDASIGEYIPHVVEVDLQDNLLYKWKDISTLMSSLPGLRKLQLHGNKMQPFTSAISETLPTKPCFGNLSVLALNACGVTTWSSVLLLASHAPSLGELYLSANQIGDIPGAGAEDCFGDLRVLDISGCGVFTWLQVLYFGKLPCLEELMLDGNPLKEITSKPADSEWFSSLTRLSISSTKLDDWSSIDAVATYPSVTNLRLSHVPLFSGKGASEVRPYVLGRIAKLDFFNGSIVHPRERIDAEKVYLRSIHRDREDAAKSGHPLSEKTLNLKHPMFKKLEEKYGADLGPMASGTIGGNLASELLNITIQNLSFSGNASNEPVSKKLPASMTVEKLKAMVQQLFNLEPQLQLLSMLLYKDSPPTLLDDDQATLLYYGTQDGAKVFVNEAKDTSSES